MSNPPYSFKAGDAVRINVPDEAEHGEIGTVTYDVDNVTPMSKTVFVTVPSVGKNWMYRPTELESIPTPQYRDLL